MTAIFPADRPEERSSHLSSRGALFPSVIPRSTATRNLLQPLREAPLLLRHLWGAHSRASVSKEF